MCYKAHSDFLNTFLYSITLTKPPKSIIVQQQNIKSKYN